MKVNNGTYGENLTGSMVTGYNGTLTFTISNKNYTAVVGSDGKFTILGTDNLAANTYSSVSASFISTDGNYKGTASRLSFTIKPQPVVIDLNATINDGVYGSNLAGSMVSGYTGTLTVVINGNTYTANVDRYGKFNITGTNALNAKSYTANVTFVSTDGAYKGSANNLEFTVAPQNTNINVKINNGTYGNNLNGTMTANYAGNLTVVIDGTPYTVHVNKGSSYSSYTVSFTLSNTNALNAKSYSNINATFISDDGNYKGEDTVSFTISPKTITPNVVINNGTYGENLNGTMVSGYNGTLTVTISGNPYAVVVDDGKFTILGTDNLEPNVYTGVSASFVSFDGNIKGTTNNLRFTVSIDIDLNATINDGVYGSNLNGSMVSNYPGTVTVKINGNTYTGSVDDYGKFTITGTNALAAKSYIGNLSFISTNGVYKGSANNVAFTIAPQNTNINVKINNGTYGSNLAGSMTANYAGNLTVVIDGTPYTVHVNKGSSYSSYTVSFTLSGTNALAAKTYTNVSASFISDDGNYKGSTNNLVFTIGPKTITTNIKINNATYGENLTGSMVSGYAGNLTVTINNVNYVATVGADGKFTILGTDKLNAKSYNNINASFISSNGNYKGSANYLGFTIAPKTIDLNATINDGVYGSNLTGSMISNCPGTLTVRINGNTYTATVGADGKFTILNTNKLAINSYTANLSFISTDGNYKGNANNVGFVISPNLFDLNATITGTYGENLTGSMVPGHVGILTIYINGIKYMTNVAVDGKFIIPDTDNLDAKVYNANLSFVSADGIYKGNETISFTLNPKLIDINATVNDGVYGENLTGSMISNYPGTLTVGADGNTYTAIVGADGKFTILGTDKINAKSYEPYQADLRFISADGNYIGNSTYYFYISPITIDIEGIIDNITYGDNLTGHVNTHGHNGTVTVHIGSGSVAPKSIAVGEDGYFSMAYIRSAGTYINEYISFKSDDGNYAGYGYANFTISPKILDLNTVISDSIYGENLTGSIVSGYAGTLTVTINGVDYTATVGADGKFTILATDKLNASLYVPYEVNVSFVSSNGNYIGTDNVIFSIYPQTIDIEAVIDDITYGDNFTGHVNTHGNNGTVIVVINGTSKSIAVGEDGYFNIEYVLYAKDYNDVTVSFMSDDGNYRGSEVVNFTVSPVVLDLNATIEDCNYGDNLTGSIIAGYAGTLIITIDGVNYTVAVGADGIINILPIYSLVPGDYSATIKFESYDGNYIGDDVVEFTIAPSPMNTIINNGYSGEPVTGHINTNGRNGTIFIYAGYNTLTATVGVDGFFTINEPLEYGDYVNTGVAFYYGDDEFEQDHANFTISPKKVIIEVTDLTITAYDSKNLVVTLKDFDGTLLVGQNVTIVFNGKNYVRTTDENGQAILTIKSSTVKTYTTTIKVAAFNEDYVASSKSVKVTIKAAYVTINDILKASTTLKSYMAKYKKAPSSVTVGSVKCTVPQLSYLMSAAIKAVYNKKKLTTKIKVINVKSSNKNYKVSVKSYKKSYLSIVNKIYAKGAKGTLYTYIKIGGKKVGFNVYTFGLAKILHYYKTHKNKLPNYCVFTSAFK